MTGGCNMNFQCSGIMKKTLSWRPALRAHRCNITTGVVRVAKPKTNKRELYGQGIYTSTIKSPSAIQMSKSLKQTQSVDKIGPFYPGRRPSHYSFLFGTFHELKLLGDR